MDLVIVMGSLVGITIAGLGTLLYLARDRHFGEDWYEYEDEDEYDAEGEWYEDENGVWRFKPYYEDEVASTP